MVGSGFYLSPCGRRAVWAARDRHVDRDGRRGDLSRADVRAARTRRPRRRAVRMRIRGLAYGDFAGFLIAWGYWISIWASLPVMALAFTGAIVNLVPALKSQAVAVVLTVGAIWFVAIVNLRGVKAAGLFAELTTYAKLVPFIAVALIGLFFIHPAQLTRVQPERPNAARVDRGARAADDVRVPRPRVGDGAGRRRARSRSDHSAFDDPRHQRRGAAVRARHAGRDGRRTARPADRFDRTVPGRGDADVGIRGRGMSCRSASSCRRSAR